jgi:thiosulfate/3-mercaptopyruvate sulfurtransferase
VEDVTLVELRDRMGDGALVVLDVRSPQEYDGSAGYHCDPRHGHIAGARNLPLDELLACRCAEDVRVLVGLPEGTEIVAYCHSGSRSAFAAQVLRGARYQARNYAGSWHEWSRDPTLPVEP